MGSLVLCVVKTRRIRAMRPPSLDPIEMLDSMAHSVVLLARLTQELSRSARRLGPEHQLAVLPDEGNNMIRGQDARARRCHAALWPAIGGGVLSGEWLWPTRVYAAEAAKIDAGD